MHSRTSYNTDDIVWGARFGDMYLPDTDRVAIDLGRLHDYVTVKPPAVL